MTDFEQWKRYVAREAEDMTEDEYKLKLKRMIDIFEYEQKRKVINKKIILRSRPPNITPELRESILKEQIQEREQFSWENFNLLMIALYEIKTDSYTEFTEIIQDISNLSE